MNNKIIFTLLIIITLSFSAQAKEGNIWVFYSGNQYLQLIQENSDVIGIEDVFIIGVNDALAFYKADGLEWIDDCSMNKTPAQLAAIFDKWLQANPEEWHKSAVTLYVTALGEACQ